MKHNAAENQSEDSSRSSLAPESNETANMDSNRTSLLVQLGLLVALLVGGGIFVWRHMKTNGPAPKDPPRANPAAARPARSEPRVIGGKTVGGFVEIPGAPFKLGEFTQQWGNLHINKNVDGRTITLGGNKYETGLGSHSASKIEIVFLKPADTFSGVFGIEDANKARAAGARFKVVSEKDVLFESGPMDKANSHGSFEVPVRGLKKVYLVTENTRDGNGYNAVSWAKLELK